jgi:excisionase family DNA binding protein
MQWPLQRDSRFLRNENRSENIRKDFAVTTFPDFSIEMAIPTSTAGRSPYAPSTDFPLTMKQAEEQNNRAIADAFAQQRLRAAVDWLMIREMERQTRVRRRPKSSTQPIKGHMLTKREVAAQYDVCNRTIERLVKAGTLRMYRIGPKGECRFKPEDIEKALVVDKNGVQIDDDFEKFITAAIGE